MRTGLWLSTQESQRALQPRTPTPLEKIHHCCTSHKPMHPLLRPSVFLAWHQHSVLVPSPHAGHLFLEGKDSKVPPLCGVAPPGSFLSAVSHHSSPQHWSPTCESCPRLHSWGLHSHEQQVEMPAALIIES